MIDVNSYVVLWSATQQKFHVESVQDMCSTNNKHFLNQQVSDYVVLDFSKNKEEAKELAKKYQAKRDEIYS
ncbi:hypothetical protein [Vibrio parahaemolyticus]|uniref:hypothetical protein n=1 Tax=Vibrio parahaemolyticus TaxID=670 RepID=UPI00112486F6|nr:hypothetical protein [Vibrio parahaemolyticus]QLE36217.1 hypothetical protein FDV79_10865 [Vibrio parahaemolyticus]TOQ93435.1 hypothetical protein CGG84_24110 [Vibrio parahaemolyticus]HCG7755669.1 hypothetical protein [Vibrio parahaemolyticus]